MKGMLGLLVSMSPLVAAATAGEVTRSGSTSAPSARRAEPASSYLAGSGDLGSAGDWTFAGGATVGSGSKITAPGGAPVIDIYVDPFLAR